MNKFKNIGSKLIKKIEKERKSKVIIYFTGDRKPFGSIIAEDAVRPLYEHLLNLDFNEENKVIDLFIYSKGGDVSVPWRVANMIREFCNEFNILIPYKAQSAATLLSLGADNIIMSKKAELGPIDPTLVKTTIGEGPLHRQKISVEDVNSFISFIKERANITDQLALAQVVGTLIKQISPLTLGDVNRQNYHIRLVARKLLTSRNKKIDEEKINTIIETLTEKIYSHGHGIGRKEAKDIGLPIILPDKNIENLIWQLYLVYENFLKLMKPIDPEIELLNDEKKVLEKLPIAIIESLKKLHIFKMNIELKKKRRIPSSPQINLNVNMQLPANIKQSQIPQKVKQIYQKLMKQISKIIPRMVQEEIIKQSPIVGIDVKIYGGKWYEEK